MKFVKDGKIWHTVSTCAPQQGCRDEREGRLQRKMRERESTASRNDSSGLRHE